MKKEDLIALGIEEEAAKSIMALHGKTVTQLNAQVATAEGERDQFKEQLETNQSELNTLKESAKDNEELTKQLTEIQEKMDTVKAETETKLLSQQKAYRHVDLPRRFRRCPGNIHSRLVVPKLESVRTS